MKRQLFASGIFLLIPDTVEADGYQIENPAD